MTAARVFRRSRAREVALQLLFQRDQNSTPVQRPAIERFTRDRLTDAALTQFALALYDGVVRHQEQVDQLISATAANWRLTRMMPSDRNILRLGTFELLHAPDATPRPVVINEAIELARRFGSVESPSFVNGILDKIAKTHAPAVPSPKS